MVLLTDESKINFFSAYGKVIIAEKFLEDNLKSIKPLSSEDAFTYSVEGILFTFVLDRLIGHSAEGAEIYEFGGVEAVDDEKGFFLFFCLLVQPVANY